MTGGALNIRRLVWFRNELRLLFDSRRTSSQSTTWQPVSYIEHTSRPNPLSPWAVRRRLNACPEAVVRYLELEENRHLSSPRSLRFGRRGSLSVSLKENNCGKWYNFETGEFGDMLDLIIKTRNIDASEALRVALADILSENPDIPPDGSKSAEKIPLEEDRISERSQEMAEKILSESVGIAGSLAASYLASRGITRLTSSHLRFHPGLHTKERSEGWLRNIPALVAVATHPAAHAHNLQVTYLDAETGRKHPKVAVPRRSYGSFSDPGQRGHRVCWLSQDSDTDISYVSEGVETGLSLCEAVERSHVVATLGKTNFLKIDPAILNRKVVLVWDNDGEDVRNDIVLKRTVASLTKAGKEVWVLVPELLPGSTKTDLNDILQSQGVSGVQRLLQEAVYSCHLSP